MSGDRGRILLSLARSAIAAKLGKTVPGAQNDAAWLSEPGACFVTLTIDGELRGCIGSLEPYRSLRRDITENALAAAFRDPRFTPLSTRELDSIRVEVSLLSPVAPISFRDEDDALTQLRPAIDGVILEYGRQRGTFLPQVWEQLPSPHLFLRHLKIKAGLGPDFWDNGIRLYRYTVEKFKESGDKNELT